MLVLRAAVHDGTTFVAVNLSFRSLCGIDPILSGVDRGMRDTVATIVTMRHVYCYTFDSGNTE
jgi:hypothetical protein